MADIDTQRLEDLIGQRVFLRKRIGRDAVVGEELIGTHGKMLAGRDDPKLGGEIPSPKGEGGSLYSTLPEGICL